MNTHELKDILSDEIQNLRDGKTKPELINAITKACTQIIAAARLDITYLKMVGGKIKKTPPFFEDKKPARGR